VLTDDMQAAAAQSDPADVATARVSALVTRQVDLVVTKTMSKRTAVAGSLFSFTVRVVNQGPSAASNVVVSDQAVSSLSGRLRPGDGISLTCTEGGASFRCTVPELLPGASVTFVVDVTTPPGTANGKRACDTALATGREPETRPADNHATACVTITAKHRPAAPFVPVTG
jgi:uncharacterized repeat protein (TIGR01451 family)